MRKMTCRQRQPSVCHYQLYLILLLILPFGLTSFSPVAQSKETIKKVDAPFVYQLFLADIKCWIDASCQGPVEDIKGDMAEHLDNILASANQSVDFAIYGLRKQSWFLDRLTQLKADGVSLRVTLDQQSGELDGWEDPHNFPYPDSPKITQLLGENLVRPDVNPDGSPRAGTIMHNKFFILDQKAVWLGSANLSDSETGTGYNANTTIFVQSRDLARLYQSEFNQMFDNRRYSIAKHAREQKTALKYNDGTMVSAYFSPQDNAINEAVIPLIDAAKKTLNIGMFFLTEVNTGEAIVRAHKRGVDVRIICDAVGAVHSASLYEYLKGHGIQIVIENWGGKMHMKTAVADHKNVVIGSMNWSNVGSTSNDENTLWIRNNKTLGASLDEYFEMLWASLEGAHPYPNAEGLNSINSCYDGIDNDFDGMTDLADPACRFLPKPRETKPR